MNKSLNTGEQKITLRGLTGNTPPVNDASKKALSETRPPLIAQQIRSRKTWRALLDAGISILADQGLSGLTIPEVSSRAGVSVGTVYRRFGDKEGLLTALSEEFTTSFRDEIHERMHRQHILEGAAPSGLVDVAVRAVVTTYRMHEGLVRVFVTLGQGDPVTFHQGREVSHEGRLFFRDLIWPVHGVVTHPDAERALDFAYRLVYAACTHRVIHGPNLESPTELSWDQLSDELVRTVNLLLFGKLVPEA